MRPIYTLSTLCLLGLGACTTSAPVPEEDALQSVVLSTDSAQYDSMLFKSTAEREEARRARIVALATHPESYQDANAWIVALHDHYGTILRPDTLPTAFKIQLLPFCGATDSVVCIDITFGKDATIQRQQYFLERDGHLLLEETAQRWQSVPIFPNEAPVLMTISNESHHFYKYINGRLVDIFDGFSDNAPATYSPQYAPNELTLQIQDVNKDSLPDLVFVGKHKAANATKWQPVRYAFVYKASKDMFIYNK